MGDENNPSKTTVQVTREIRQRLRERSAPGEPYNSVISRLLDETRQPIQLDSLVNAAMETYDDVACLHTDHGPMHDEATRLELWVYTGEAETFEDNVTDEVAPDATHVRVGTGENRLDLTFDVYATFDGPKSLDSTEGTPLYMSDSVVNSEHLAVETGIEYLERKLTEPDWWEQPNSVGLAHIRERLAD